MSSVLYSYALAPSTETVVEGSAEAYSFESGIMVLDQPRTRST